MLSHDSREPLKQVNAVKYFETNSFNIQNRTTQEAKQEEKTNQVVKSFTKLIQKTVIIETLEFFFFFFCVISKRQWV